MKGYVKKIALFMLLLSMIFGGATSALAKDNMKVKEKHKDGKYKVEIKLEFDDVDMEWARAHIASLAAKGVFQGYADGTFKPNNHVTRQEAIVTAVRLMGLKELAESDAKKKSHLNLKDEKKIDDWARGYVAVALENGLFFETDDKLDPNKPADRLWVTMLLVKALDLDAEALAKMNTKLSFKDSKSIPAGSAGYVAVAVEKGIVQGYANGNFQPNKPVTRAEIAAFLDRAGVQLPNDDAVRGVLSNPVTNNVLTLSNGTQLIVDPNAFVFKDGKKIALSDLRAGDSVVLRMYQNVVIFIEVVSSSNTTPGQQWTMTGTLESKIKNNEVAIQTDKGKVEKYKLASKAVLIRNGVNAAASELVAGDQVIAQILNQEIILLSATSKQAVNDYFQGTISATVQNNMLSIYKDGGHVQYPLHKNVDIFRNNKRVTASELQLGDEVFVRVENSQIVLVTVMMPAKESVTIQATVVMVSVDNNVIVLRHDGKDTAYLIDDGAKLYRKNALVKADQLKANDVVSVKAQENKIVFLQVTELAEEREFIVVGFIQSFTLNSQGKLATISILDSSNQQVSIYNVATDVKITGETSKLQPNFPVELKGRNQMITHITLK